MTRAERRSQRLLRCYPRAWRERYEDELTALLIDDLADRPRSLRRDLDVVRAGLCARLAACGLARGPVQDRSATTAVAAVAAVGFVASALSIWTQLADGWLTAPAEPSAVTVSLVALSIWLGGLLVLTAVLGMKISAAGVRALRSGGAALVLRPLAVLAGSAAVLIAGIGLMAPRWPGERLVHRGLMAQAARIGWAATDPISTFWLHPTRLLTLPAGELAWMVLCPVAVVALGMSVVRVVRVTGPLPQRLPRHLSSIAPLAVLPCLVAAVCWVVGSQNAANLNYRAGTLDLALIAVMVAATWVASAARHRAAANA